MNILHICFTFIVFLPMFSIFKIYFLENKTHIYQKTKTIELKHHTVICEEKERKYHLLIKECMIQTSCVLK